MIGVVLGLLGAYVVSSIILLKRPEILHKKKKNAIYARHISHRGGAGERIENTMPAFERAVSLGTDMLELDCHLLFDGEVVVSHDSDLSRLTGVQDDISRYTKGTLPPIRDTLQLTFDPDHCVTATSDAEKRFCLLEDVFKAFPKVAVNIDIKIDDDDLIVKVDRLVRKYGREHLTVWGNRSDAICKKCLVTNPATGMLFSQRRIIETVLLFYVGLLPFVPIREGYLEIPMLRLFLEPQYRVFGMGWRGRLLIRILDKLLMSPSLFGHLRARGIPTFLWVCNSKAAFKEAFDAGAAGVMTDYPGLLRAFLEERPPSNGGPGEADRLVGVRPGGDGGPPN